MNRVDCDNHRLARMTRIIALVIALMGLPVTGQQVSEWTQSKLIRVRIAMQEVNVPLTKAPWLVLTVQNMSDHPLQDDGFDLEYRVTVLKDNKELRRTRLYRQLRHEPGLPELDMGGPPDARRIDVGATVTREFDLAKYYEFEGPGKYSVYVEILDLSGKWRTNTVVFEMQTSSQ